MNITIIGGGNNGTLMAAEAADKGHTVTVCTSRPNLWKKEIEVYNPDANLLISTQISKITSSMKDAVSGADHIWVTVPGEAFENVAARMLPYATKGQKIGIIPGFGGAEFAFKKLIDKGCILYGFQRVHSIARLKEYGKSVYQLGRKHKIEIGSIPASNVSDICDFIEGIFNIPCVSLYNYLSVSLTPSNPILHTSRLYSMVKDYTPGKKYDGNFLFYKEWSLEVAQMMISCREEELGMGTVLEFCREYQYVPADFEQEETFGERIYKFSKEALVKKISK